MIIKVWDIRNIGTNKQVGSFLGHQEAVTSLDSKGDGRYLASNSKDQLVKVWDLRKMLTNEQVESCQQLPRSVGFDFTTGEYPLYDKQKKLKDDTSVLTFKGHHVYNALIKCQFSP